MDIFKKEYERQLSVYNELINRKNTKSSFYMVYMTDGDFRYLPEITFRLHGSMI